MRRIIPLLVAASIAAGAIPAIAADPSHWSSALIQAAIPELGSTQDWTNGPAITGPHDPNLRPGTAIGYGWDSNGNWLGDDHGSHAAIVDKVDAAGIVWVIDQYDFRDKNEHGSFQVAMSRKLKPGEEKRYSIITRRPCVSPR